MLRVVTIKEETAETAAARIQNGALELRFASSAEPVIIPAPGVQLTVNGKQVTGRAAVSAEDEVECTVKNETKQSVLSIQLVDQQMSAKAVITPGKQITRILIDSSWQEELKIQTTEKIEFINTISASDIVAELQKQKIIYGVQIDEITRAVESPAGGEFTIAKGTPAIEGKDSILDVRKAEAQFEIAEEDRVNFRDRNIVESVKAGQLIAVHIPAVSGADGMTVTGKKLLAKKPKDLLLRPGKYVTVFHRKIYTKIDGRPVIEKRGKMVKIDVNKEYRLASDVTMESGNIYFEGDVWIGGSIRPSMFVSASNEVRVVKNCTKASIRATKAVHVQGSIFSSTVTAGIQEKIILLLLEELVPLLDRLLDIQAALQQLFAYRGERVESVLPETLKQAVQLLLEQKYGNFIQMTSNFIQIVKNHSRRLEKEWLTLAVSLYAVFVDANQENEISADALEKIIDNAKLLLDIYREEQNSDAVLETTFAMNSILYSSGDIRITSKGVYNSSLTALGRITIKGVCRGGEVTAEKNIELDESGSAAGVKTEIRTAAEGMIVIQKAYAGTVIQVGSRRAEILETTHQICAKLDEQGNLRLHEK